MVFPNMETANKIKIQWGLCFVGERHDNGTLAFLAGLIKNSMWSVFVGERHDNGTLAFLAGFIKTIERLQWSRSY